MTYGLTARQAEVLAFIHDATEQSSPPTAEEIAFRFSTLPESANTMIDRLVERGHVERKSSWNSSGNTVVVPVKEKLHATNSSNARMAGR